MDGALNAIFGRRVRVAVSEEALRRERTVQDEARGTDECGERTADQTGEAGRRQQRKDASRRIDASPLQKRKRVREKGSFGASFGPASVTMVGSSTIEAAVSSGIGDASSAAKETSTAPSTTSGPCVRMPRTPSAIAAADR